MMLAYRKYLIIGSLVLIVGGAFFWHYTNLLKKVGAMEVTIREEQKAHEATKQSFQAFVAETTRNFERQQQTLNEYAKAFQKYEEDYNELQTILSKHNLEALFQAKPGLMERRINDGTERVLNDIRAISAFEYNLNTGEGNLSKAKSNSTP